MLSFCQTDSRLDVLVTGVGLVTPLGCSVDETWPRLIRGDRAGRTLTPRDVDHFNELSEIPGLQLNGAPVAHEEVGQRLRASPLLRAIDSTAVAAWRSEPLIAMSLLALEEALTNASLRLPLVNPDRLAVVFGSSKGGLRTAERLIHSRSRRPAAVLQIVGGHEELSGDGLACFSAEDHEFGELWTHAFQPDSVTRAITAITSARAGSSCPVAACATGLISVLQGAAMVHAGLCDICIVGSSDAALRASVLSSFHRLRVTSRHSDGATACRPFDASRNGFIVGEGAAVMVLESRRHAMARGGKGIARVSGGGWLNDPTGMTQIDTSGAVVSELLKRTVCRETVPPDVISLHGTGTESNDLAEARGIRSAFGTSAPRCFGIKGSIGHLLGAAGSVETALTVLSLHHRMIPGTTNLETPDADCAIPLTGMSQSIPSLRRAAKLSLGFGGHVACGIFDAV